MFLFYDQAQTGHAVIGLDDIGGRAGKIVDFPGQFFVIHYRIPFSVDAVVSVREIKPSAACNLFCASS